MFQHFAQKRNTEVLVNEISKRNISWHFNPPYSPHFGGLWEAGIRSAKYHLKRVIKDQVLTFEELSTLFCKIEAVMNSRPLCPLSTDPSEFDVLTPGHFLIGSPMVSVPEYDVIQLPDNRLNRWKLLRKASQSFWDRWKAEYLHTLQRFKWNVSVPNVAENDLVIVKDDKLPPLHWRVARVEACFPGTDQLTRVVRLRTADGCILRPVAKICPLPNP